MYFTMSQIQYLGLALIGGLILIAVIAIGYWSYRLHVSTRKEGEGDTADISASADDETYTEEFREGHEPIPLLIVILIPLLILWGIGYTLAHAFGVFYAQ